MCKHFTNSIYKFFLFLFNNFFNVIFFCFCLFINFSCSNTSPSVVNVDAKIVYDYEDANKVPIQKMSLFLKMESDVRRVETINVYNSQTGFRWIISNPIITQAYDYQYAGYTNICATNQDEGLLPQGDYTVLYVDAEGRDSFSNFKVEYDQTDAKLNVDKLKSKLKDKKIEIFIGIYSNTNMLYYDVPKKEWNVKLDENNINKQNIFSKFNKAQYFRLFIFSDNNVYILPKVYKLENNKE